MGGMFGGCPCVCGRFVGVLTIRRSHPAGERRLEQPRRTGNQTPQHVDRLSAPLLAVHVPAQPKPSSNQWWVSAPTYHLSPFASLLSSLHFILVELPPGNHLGQGSDSLVTHPNTSRIQRRETGAGRRPY